jgi:hypothetical protein
MCFAVFHNVIAHHHSQIQIVLLALMLSWEMAFAMTMLTHQSAITTWGTVALMWSWTWNVLLAFANQQTVRKY